MSRTSFALSSLAIGLFAFCCCWSPLMASASGYESQLDTAELLAAAVAGSSSASQYGAPSGSSGYGCVLTIRPANYSTAPQYPEPQNYLSNYASQPATRGGLGAYGPPASYGPSKSICISQQDVDSAVEEAEQSLGGYVPKEIYAANSESPKPMHVSVVAEIITQATRILANRFKLPEPAILYELPAVDLSKSQAIDKICPTFLKPSVNCEHGRFRTLTGFCNNLQYQSWGSARSAMVRFLAPDYYDSISLPRRAYDGSPLPSARVVSFVVHQDPAEYDKYHSMLSVVWGQFIDHDMTLAVQATDENPTTGPGAIDCCKSEDMHPDCFPIEIPKGDPFYGYFNQKCMHFTRAAAGLQPGCSLGPVQAMNKISGFLDGNMIYGSTIKVSQRLRTYQMGQLRSQQVSSSSAYGSTGSGIHSGSQSDIAGEYLAAAASISAGYPSAESYPQLGGGGGGHLLKELLPPKKIMPDFGCERRGRAKDVYCFEAGDPRANEQIQLTTMHTIFMREHNRLARQLYYINPHWDDERLFQEARQIVVAQMQHITFNEFLPLVIGKDKIYEYGLELEQPGRYYQGYDAKINAGVRVEFQAAAFRYGHSILPSYIERYNKHHQKIESIRLSKLLKQPYDLYHPGVIDSYMLGLINQRSGRMDPTLTTEVTNHLFEKPGKFFGIDLAAINIQRGRDMGVPGYNHFREYCGLPRAKCFEDLSGVFSNKTLLRMSQLYKHVDDIDLWTAGISEYPINDGLVGPTFSCLIARQFVNLRRGDRFWYENGPQGNPAYPQPAQFTIEQLDELRKSTSGRLLCDNSDDIETIQASPMLVPDPHTNPRVPCVTLPSIDLTKWKDSPAGYQQQQQPQPSGGNYQSAGNELAEAVASAEYGAALASAAAALSSASTPESYQPAPEMMSAAEPDTYESARSPKASFNIDHLVATNNQQYQAEQGAPYAS